MLHITINIIRNCDNISTDTVNTNVFNVKSTIKYRIRILLINNQAIENQSRVTTLPRSHLLMTFHIRIHAVRITNINMCIITIRRRTRSKYKIRRLVNTMSHFTYLTRKYNNVLRINAIQGMKVTRIVNPLQRRVHLAMKNNFSVTTHGVQVTAIL